MNKVVLFSGGFDSTYALAELCRTATADDKIIAVSFQHNLTGACKNHRECEQQCRIIGAIRHEYPNVKLNYEVIRIESLWSVGSTFNCRGLSHPIFWSCNLIPLLADNDAVYFGYIKGDDAIQHVDKIRELFYDACAIQEYKNIQVEFPNIHFDKVDVIYKLLKDYPWLVDLCISCESEDYNGLHVCGYCVPCQHLKRALVQLLISDDEDVTKWAEAKYMQLFGKSVSVESDKREETKVLQVDDRPVDDTAARKPRKKFSKKKHINYSTEDEVYVDPRFD